MNYGSILIWIIGFYFFNHLNRSCFLLVLSVIKKCNQEIKGYRFRRLMSVDDFLLLYQNHLCILFMHFYMRFYIYLRISLICVFPFISVLRIFLFFLFLTIAGGRSFYECLVGEYFSRFFESFANILLFESCILNIIRSAVKSTHTKLNNLIDKS